MKKVMITKAGLWILFLNVTPVAHAADSLVPDRHYQSDPSEWWISELMDRIGRNKLTDTFLEDCLSNGHVDPNIIIFIPQDSGRNHDTGETLLGHAVRSNNIERAEIILKAGANPNLVDKFGKIAVDYTNDIHSSSSLPMIQLLHRYRADISSARQRLSTPLMTAMGRGDEELVAYLIAQHVDLNAQMPATGTHVYNGATALMMSAQGLSAKNLGVSRLIQAGAALDIQDESGKTALMHAAKWNRSFKEIEPLVFAGANPLLKDKAGKNALSYLKEMVSERWSDFDIPHRKKARATLALLSKYNDLYAADGKERALAEIKAFADIHSAEWQKATLLERTEERMQSLWTSLLEKVYGEKS